MRRFKNESIERRHRKVAKEHGIAAVELTRGIRRRMTAKEKRPAGPEHVGVEDPQRDVILSYEWVCEQYSMGRSTADMAQAANITQVEMDHILDDYSLQDNEETHALCGLRRPGHN